MRKCLLSLLLVPLVALAEKPPSTTALARALASEDIPAIRAAVTAGRTALGNRAGEPEVADTFLIVPKGATLLTRAEALQGFTPYFARLEKMRWWKVGVDPTTLTAPLRAPASMIAGNAAAVRAKLDGAERSIAVAKEAAEFLMWAQEQAGTGLYPFPAARGKTDDKAMAVAAAFLAKAEKFGNLDSVVRNGWAYDDLGGGGLQFDNAECGVAMFELYELTHDERVLASARKAADWAASRPLCPNWNYNSFSVYLLAKAYSITNDPRYLDSAIRKARLGVIPGQLTDGPYTGRWIDPHNARPAYHYIILRALAQLAAVLPKDHIHRAEVINALALGLKARNTEMLVKGVMNKDKAIEALLLVNHVFKDDETFLRDTLSKDALHAIALLVSEEARQGKAPLSPREWGHFLEFIAGSAER
ncbi:MAG: hypothetical protein WCJ02_04640 [bacterium]